MCKLANPDYTIHLKNLTSPSEVMQFCKQQNIRNYAYAFIYNSPIEQRDFYLKIGRSAPGGSIGERIYRQAGHVPGWAFPLTGPSGSDIAHVIDLFEKTFPVNTKLLTINNVSICIWDVTNVVNTHLTDDAYPTRVCENQLLDEYEEIHGCLPLGNLKDTRNEMMAPYVGREHYESLFEEST